MPFTIITLKNVPNSLRGDLTRWMQEIATGVYIGNFNRKVREHLWSRVKESTGVGEATISYASRNEIGYDFETLNTKRIKVFNDGIPIVLFPKEQKESSDDNAIKAGFSNAARFRKAKRFSTYKPSLKKKFIVLDIETTGLDYGNSYIIEIGALKVFDENISYYHSYINDNLEIPKFIQQLTGITKELLVSDGLPLKDALKSFKSFVDNLPIAGYNINFDISFINYNLKNIGEAELTNKTIDILYYVKRDNLFLKNYKLETVLNAYGLGDTVPHRALEDAKLIYKLSMKLNNFQEKLNQNR